MDYAEEFCGAQYKNLAVVGHSKDLSLRAWLRAFCIGPHARDLLWWIFLGKSFGGLCQGHVAVKLDSALLC